MNKNIPNTKPNTKPNAKPNAKPKPKTNAIITPKNKNKSKEKSDADNIPKTVIIKLAEALPINKIPIPIPINIEKKLSFPNNIILKCSKCNINIDNITIKYTIYNGVNLCNKCYYDILLPNTITNEITSKTEKTSISSILNKYDDDDYDEDEDEDEDVENNNEYYDYDEADEDDCDEDNYKDNNEDNDYDEDDEDDDEKDDDEKDSKTKCCSNTNTNSITNSDPNLILDEYSSKNKLKSLILINNVYRHSII